MSKNIFAELKAEYPFLTPVEKKIADFIMDSPQHFITYSMPTLSQMAGVSQGSINNFSKKFSDGGYSALKLRIAGSLSYYEEKPFTAVENADNMREVLKLKMDEIAVAFENTLEINREENLQRAVELILNARKINIYGVYRSGIVGKDFCYQLIQWGIPATFVDDSLMCAVSASILNENDLVVAISASGKTKEILDAVEIVKEHQIPVICLTHDKTSPLAKMSDVVLLSASSGLSVSDRMDEVRLSQLFVLDAICSYIRSAVSEQEKNQYYKMMDVLRSHNVSDEY